MLQGSDPNNSPPANSVVELLNENQVAQRLGVSIATVRRWRGHNAGPRFRKIGASVRYAADDLKAWLEAQPSGGAIDRPWTPTKGLR
jgi:predicted DNA-binding transcriptional regulator AlpA